MSLLGTIRHYSLSIRFSMFTRMIDQLATKLVHAKRFVCSLCVDCFSKCIRSKLRLIVELLVVVL